MGPVYNPNNGRYYSLLSQNSWSASATEAQALGGNLATINDAAENNWVFDTFSAGQRNLWIGLQDTNLDGVFAWVDGAPVSYTNWGAGQPNLGTERWVIIIKGDIGAGQVARSWHDVQEDGGLLGQVYPIYGVVKLTSAPYCVAHAAKATATVINGFLVGATMTDYGCGYTNPPLVVIQGGGGSGASGTAVITNGLVSRIIITSAGCCYTSDPQIIIASPPFIPSLSIRVSKVKVTQRVVLGKSYILETSTNLVDWVPTGPPFTPSNESVSDEFDVDLVGRYFRLLQQP
jgi:hypothetical protein